MGTLSRLLKESWSLVEDRADTMVGYFFAAVFLAEPRLRKEFPLQMDRQRAQLLTGIAQAVQTIDDPQQFDSLLRGFRRRIHGLHLEPEHYIVIGDCLVVALREHTRGDWSPRYEQAWREAYAMFAEKMLSGAEADAETGQRPYWHGEVVSHERRTHDIAVFTVRPDQPLPYRPGQYVTLETHHRAQQWRPYSIATAPRPDNLLEFHVKAVGAGWVSTALVWKLRPGDRLRIGPPTGSMTLDPRSRHDIVCVAGSTGLAPMKAMVGELARANDTGHRRRMHLFVGARRREDFYDIPALRQLEDRHSWLTVVQGVSDDPTYPGPVGNICDVALGHGPWREHDFFVSGSSEMVRVTLRRLIGADIPMMRIKYDIPAT